MKSNVYSNWAVLRGAILYVLPTYKHKCINFVEDVRTAYIELNLLLSNENLSADELINYRLVKYVLESRLLLLKDGIYDLPDFRAVSAFSEKRIFEVLRFKPIAKGLHYYE
jgi:hypothetical protein